MAKIQANKTIDGRLDHLEHLAQVLIRGQEQIKSHLWRQPENQPTPPDKKDNRKIIEFEAVSYIHNVVIPDLAKKENEKGEMVAEGVWIEWAAKPIVEFLKTKALEYIGKALIELRNQLIPIAVNVAKWALGQLESIILKKYEKADEELKETFKKAIEESFPDSHLLSKLN